MTYETIDPNDESTGLKLFEYESNNSGGYWWLKDKDWVALQKAGWKVKWYKDENNPDSIRAKTLNDEGRWLRALASRATKEFLTLKECIKEFEEVTKQDVSDNGCNCCGAPHTFNWRMKEDDEQYDYAYGSNLLEYMYNKVPKTLRDACE